MPASAGTTKKKRRSKKQEAAEQLLKEKQDLVAWVFDLQKRGATVFKVWGKDGRRKVEHRVILYKGALFFPDHGKASVKELMAENELRSTTMKDACISMACLHLYGHAGGLPTARSRQWKNRHRMTRATEEWWSDEALKHIEGIRTKRDERANRKRPCTDPISTSTPFSRSARARINPIYHRIHAEMQEKLERVTKKLTKKGHEQAYPW